MELFKMEILHSTPSERRVNGPILKQLMLIKVGSLSRDLGRNDWVQATHFILKNPSSKSTAVNQTRNMSTSCVS